jgi:hypothetical protein
MVRSRMEQRPLCPTTPPSPPPPTYDELYDQAMAACRADPFFAEIAHYEPAYILDYDQIFDVHGSETTGLLSRLKLTLIYFHLYDPALTYESRDAIVGRFAEHFAPDEPGIRQMLTSSAKHDGTYAVLNVMRCVLRWAEKKNRRANLSAAVGRAPSATTSRA